MTLAEWHALCTSLLDRCRSLTSAPTQDSELLSAAVQAAELADLVKRLLAVLFAAAALCMPNLDGTQNLDAFEVTADDAGADGDADDEASPDVTVLITGALPPYTTAPVIISQSRQSSTAMRMSPESWCNALWSGVNGVPYRSDRFYAQ